MRFLALLMLLVSPLLAQQGKSPILYCTQVPSPHDYLTVTSTFGNHQGTAKSAVRGGDLMIVYPSGVVRNLTREAGYGEEGVIQGENAIAVREPEVHWSGDRALFSMVVGSPALNEEREYYWQVYEMRNFHEGGKLQMWRVPGQPENRNNVSPFYFSDGRIGFASDEIRDRNPLLYPQLDEYEEAPTNSGVWSLDPFTEELRILDNSPSGAFGIFVDSYGRIIYGRWDHLERDQQKYLTMMNLGNYPVINYVSEVSNDRRDRATEIFPEPQGQWVEFVRNNGGADFDGDLWGWKPGMVGNRFNHFLPWQMFQDGTRHETLNHVGRQELFSLVARSSSLDPALQNLHNLGGSSSVTENRMPITSMHQITEHPSTPGLYLGVDCPPFKSHSAGQIIAMWAAEGQMGHRVQVSYVTHRDTHDTTQTPSENHSGLYRDPVVLPNDILIASHTENTSNDRDVGSPLHPRSTYDFRLTFLRKKGDVYVPEQTVLPQATSRTVVWHDPYRRREYSGPLWELYATPVFKREVPKNLKEPPLAKGLSKLFHEFGLSEEFARSFLKRNDLSLVVIGNVLRRDSVDKQQPYHLRVPIEGQETVVVPAEHRVYPVTHLQIYQGDYIRSIGYTPTYALPGRRVLAQPLHDGAVVPSEGAPRGAAKIASDGSVAFIAPANRPLSWELVDPEGESVVRERYWLNFQPGEIRSCDSCHGINAINQHGEELSVGERPKALVDLLEWITTL